MIALWRICSQLHYLLNLNTKRLKNARKWVYEKVDKEFFFIWTLPLKTFFVHKSPWILFAWNCVDHVKQNSSLNKISHAELNKCFSHAFTLVHFLTQPTHQNHLVSLMSHHSSLVNYNLVMVHQNTIRANQEIIVNSPNWVNDSWRIFSVNPIPLTNIVLPCEEDIVMFKRNQDCFQWWRGGKILMTRSFLVGVESAEIKRNSSYSTLFKFDSSTSFTGSLFCPSPSSPGRYWLKVPNI